MRVIFVHGAFTADGTWWWRPTAEILARNGVTSTAAILPSCEREPRGDLHDDAAAVRALLDSSDEPATVVGHSYGGMVITEAAAGHSRVERLVYLASFLPDVTESLSELGDGGPPVLANADGTVEVRPEAIREKYAHDFDDALFEAAAARLTRQSQLAFTQQPTAAAWREIPSTYVVFAEDRGTPPEVQRAQAARAGDVVELPVPHHAFVTRPALVAEVLLRS